jgi:serine/threonine protein kinase
MQDSNLPSACDIVITSSQEDGTRANVAVKEIRSDDEDLQKEVEKNWETELKNLQEISRRDHQHIVKFIAAFQKGEKRYLILKWADGGNLREYWAECRWRGINASMIKEMLIQLHGLADGLFLLHNYNGTSDGYRHGDLKPENILRCKSRDNPNGLGILKIADMGLAKRHPFATNQRPNGTSTRFGTVRYEPPEALFSLKPRSRLYDIWSMGCIILEYLVWLLYGPEELERFHKSVRSGDARDVPLFDTKPGLKGHRTIIRPIVNDWMDHMTRDPECSKDTAIRDLLDLVKSKLLVIPLPPNRETNQTAIGTSKNGENSAVNVEGEEIEIEEAQGPPYRATAKIFRSSLKRILDKAEDSESYVFTGSLRTNLRGPQDKDKLTSLLPPDNARRGERRAVRPDVRHPPRESLGVVQDREVNVSRHLFPRDVEK